MKNTKTDESVKERIWDYWYGEKKGHPTPEDFAYFLSEIFPEPEGDSDDLVQQLFGRADFLEDRGQVKTPGLLRQAAYKILSLI